jgi:hypothetical protein
MAETAYSGTVPARLSTACRRQPAATNLWPDRAVEAPPPTPRMINLSEPALRAIIVAFQQYGDTHAARLLQKSLPILDLPAARHLISTMIKPMAVAIAREIARREASAWSWESGWRDRLAAKARAGHAQVLKQRREARA